MNIGPNFVPALLLGFAIIFAAYLIASQPHGRFTLGMINGRTPMRLDTQTGEMVACPAANECFLISGPRIKND